MEKATKQENIRVEAEKILRSLANDANPGSTPNQEFWWKNTLADQRDRYLETLEFIHRNYRKKKILEIGCLPGIFTVLLKKLGFDIKGADIDPDRVKSVWKKFDITVEKVDIERDNLPFPSNSFDLVVFEEVLEHLRINPLQALKEIYRVLKPKGRIFLSVPNITLIQRLLFVFGEDYQGDPIEEFTELETYGSMGHIRLYSFEESRRFLEHAGFKIDSHTYRCQLPAHWTGWKSKVLMRLFPSKRHFSRYLTIVAHKTP